MAFFEKADKLKIINTIVHSLVLKLEGSFYADIAREEKERREDIRRNPVNFLLPDPPVNFPGEIIEEGGVRITCKVVIDKSFQFPAA